MQAYNKYYPPDYDGKSSLNSKNKKSTGKQVVRFETPFDLYCLSCDKRIGKGNRYNAEKTRAGEYLSIPVWDLTIKCHFCSGSITIRTNPQDACYEVAGGARKAAQTPNQMVDSEKEHSGDPFSKLENKVEKEMKIDSQSMEIERLLKANSANWNDTFGTSQRLRHIFREEKKRIKKRKEEEEIIQSKSSLAIPIVPKLPEDDLHVSKLEFGRRSHLSLTDLVLAEIDPFSSLPPKRRKFESSSVSLSPLIDYSDSD